MELLFLAVGGVIIGFLAGGIIVYIILNIFFGWK